MSPGDTALPRGLRRWAIVFAAVLGSAVFDLTWIIVGVALPHMQGSFSATPDQIAWVMTAFIVGGTVMTAVSGWASTRFGRKQLFVVALLANTVTTAMCGLADSLLAMVAWRFAQGMFSAPLLALGQSLTIDAFPESRRSFATGLWGAATVGAVVVAPALGGYLVETFDWRWVFFANLPLGATAALCAWLFIPRSEPDPGRRLEWFGFTAIVVAVGALQLGLSRGERNDWFDSAEITLELSVAGLAFLFAVASTIFSRQPFLDRRIFLDRNYAVSIGLFILFGGLVTLPMVIMPVMLQQVNGFPAIAAGTLMLPRGMGLVVMMLVIGHIMNRFDPRLVLALGFAIAASANLYMSTWTIGIAPAAIMWTNFVHGCAAGIVYVPMVSIALSTLVRQLHTEGQTFMFLMLNIGKALGVAAVFALHTRLLQINYAVMSENVAPSNERLRLQPLPESWDIETETGLANWAAEIAHQAELIAYLNAYLAIGVVTLAAIPLVLMASRPRRSGAR